MRLRIDFEFQAGVCLWADDEEARARWTSAVAFSELELTASVRATGEALCQRFDAVWNPADLSEGPRWTDDEEAAFAADVEAWQAVLQPELNGRGIALTPWGTTPAAATQDDAIIWPEGWVLACFADAATATQASADGRAENTWRTLVTWRAANLRDEADAPRPPLEWLETLAEKPGFVAGWWQESEGGPSPFHEGDPDEEAALALAEGNVTGWLNFIRSSQALGVVLADAWASAEWTPARQHRLGSPTGSAWEWASFLKNAVAVLKGKSASSRYRRQERERMQWAWTEGGSRAGWPATWAEAIERAGFRRERFRVWRKIEGGG